MSDTTANLGLHYALQSPFNALESRRYLDEIDNAFSRVFLCVTDLGATGDGTTDDTTAIQDTLDAIPSEGGTVFFPRGTFKTGPLFPKPRTHIWISPGATLLAIGGSPNDLFHLSNSFLSSTTLTTGIQGSQSLVVASSSGYVAGDRIIVSSGTFTGSGVEEGPLEFNTVASVPDSTHISIVTPLKYNYSGFGLTGAAPKVHRLGPESSILRDLQIDGGGRILADSSFGSVFFNFANVERIEIAHLRLEGTVTASDCVQTTGHNVSELNYHHNRSTWGAFNIASMVDSKIVKNKFLCPAETTSSGTSHNHLVLEVTCRDNIIAENDLGPVRCPDAGAVELTFNCFNNHILNNRIWGLNADVVASTSTLGIRTFANGVPSNTGSVIYGNEITDIMVGISDLADQTVISGNKHYNASLHAWSTGIVSHSSKGTIGPNSFKNIARTPTDESSNPIIIRTTFGDENHGLFWGAGSPESAVTASVGSSYLRNDGGRSTTLYAKESGTGNTGWAALVSVGSVTGSGLTMVTAKLLGRSTASTGAIEEITIGTNLTLSGGTLSAAGASGATTALDNLASVAINASLLPGTTNSIDLGSSSKTWRDGYFGTSIGIGTFGSADFTQHNLQVKANVNSGISYPLAVANLATTGGDGNGVGIDFYVRDVPGTSNRLAGAIAASYSDVNNQRTKLTFQVKSGGSDRVVVLTLDHNGDATILGLIKAGSGPTTLTDAAGKILSAALNTVGTAQGGTGVDNSTGGTANQFWARPNGSTGAAAYRAIVAADIPTLNQSTSGNAATATALATARTIGGVSFDGTANITVATATGGFTISGGTGLNLASGAVVNFNSGNFTITHSSAQLALAGGRFDVAGTYRASGQSTAFGSGAGIEFSYASNVGYIQSYSRDSGTNKTLYISGNPIQLNNGNEGGVTVGSAADKGGGSISAVTVWRNGTSLDSVFDQDYELLSIDQMGEFLRVNRHLPTIPTNEVHQGGSTNLGALEDRLWETTETHALYILQLNDRIKFLETKITELERHRKQHGRIVGPTNCP